MCLWRMVSQKNNAKLAAAEAVKSEENHEMMDTQPQNKPTNVEVLNIAFFSFVGFMTFQAIFALIAHSQSMMADCEAMSVDAVTYLFNLCAERIKNRPPTEAELKLSPGEIEYRRELRRLYLEMIPPSISVSTLILITISTFLEALHTLYETKDKEQDVSVAIMLCVSALNLLLDFVNVTCFARAEVNFGLRIVREEQNLIRRSLVDGVDMKRLLVETQGSPCGNNEDNKSATEENKLLPSADSLVTAPATTSYGSGDGDGHDEEPVNDKTLVNLNMCSAWTHVCADTLRSAAVLIVAAIATIFPSIDGSVADSVAAIVVSIIILISLIPLIQGLFLTFLQIREHWQHCPLREN